jgi:hypothetical protein
VVFGIPEERSTKSKIKKKVLLQGRYLWLLDVFSSCCHVRCLSEVLLRGVDCVLEVLGCSVSGARRLWSFLL